MNSDSSKVGDMVSADVINICLKNLPVNIDRLNTFEYSLFTLFFNLSKTRGICNIFSYVTVAFTVFQRFSAFNISLIITGILRNDNIISQIFSIILNFRYTNTLEYLSVTYFFSLQIIASLSVGSVIYGLLLMHKKKQMSRFIQVFIFVFGFQVCFISYVPSTIIVFSQLSQILDNRPYILITPTVFLSIIWIFQTFIYYFITMFRHSFFGGTFANVYHSSSHSTDFLFLIILISAYGASTFMNEKDSMISVGLIIGLCGGVMIYNTFRSIYTQTIQAAHYTAEGIVMICTCIFSVLFAFKEFAEPSVLISINVAVYIFSFVVIFITYESKFKKFAEELSLVSSNFDHLQISSDCQFIKYYSAGFCYSVSSCHDGTFLAYGLRKFNLHNFKYGLLMYAAFLPDCSAAKMLLKLAESEHYISMSSKFQIYQFKRIKGMRCKVFQGEAEQMLQTTHDVIKRFQTIFNCFVEVLPHESQDLFVFADAISALRNAIRNSVRYWTLLFPNSSDIIRLYAEYKENVEFKQNTAEICYLATIFDDGDTYYKYFEDIDFLSRWPHPIDRLYPVRMAPQKLAASLRQSQTVHQIDSQVDPISRGSFAWQLTSVIMCAIMICCISFIIICFGCTKKIMNTMEYTSETAHDLVNLNIEFSILYYAPIDAKMEEKDRMYTDAEIISSTKKKFDHISEIVSKIRVRSEWFRSTEFEIKTLVGTDSIYSTMDTFINRYFSLALHILPAEGKYVDELTYAMADNLMTTTLFLDVVTEAGCTKVVEEMEKSVSDSSMTVIITCIVLTCLDLLLFLPLMIYWRMINLAKEEMRARKSNHGSALLSLYLKRAFITERSAFTQIIALIIILALLAWLFVVYLYIDYNNELGEFGPNLYTAIRESSIMTHLSGSVAALVIKYLKLESINESDLFDPINNVLSDLSGSFTVLSMHSSEAVGLYIELTNYILLQVCGSELCERINIIKEFERTFTSFKPLVTEACESYIDGVLTEGRDRKMITAEVNILASVILIIVLVNLFEQVEHLDCIYRVCVQMTTVEKNDSTTTYKKKDILDLIDRPAAITFGDVVYYANRLYVNKHGQLEKIVGKYIDPKIVNQYTKITFDGMSLYYETVTQIIDKLKEKIVRLNDDVEKLILRVNPIVDSPYIAQAEISLYPIKAAQNNDEFEHNLGLFENFLQDLLESNDNIQQANWSIRGNSLLIKGETARWAMFNCLNVCSRILLGVVDAEWDNCPFGVTIAVNVAKNEGGPVESLDWIEARGFGSRNSIVMSQKAWDALGSYSSYIPADKLADGYGIYSEGK